MRVIAFLLLSAAWSASDTAACPMSARMRAFPPEMLDHVLRRMEGIHHYKIGVRINRFKRTSHGLIEKFLTVVRITLNEGIDCIGIVQRGPGGLGYDRVDAIFGGDFWRATGEDFRAASKSTLRTALTARALISLN